MEPEEPEAARKGEKERNICLVDAFTCWKTHPVREVNKYIAEEPKMPKPGGGRGLVLGLIPVRPRNVVGRRYWQKKKKANFFCRLKLI